MKISLHAPGGKFLSGRTFASLREHHNYRLYFSGQFLSQIGTWLQSAAMAWLVLELTHSAFAVGMLIFWQFGPYVLFGLFGGALSDRFDHRITLLWTQIAPPGYLQGRVAGLYSYIFSGTNSFGALLAGALADSGGTQLAFIVAGGTALVLAAFGFIMRRRDFRKDVIEKPKIVAGSSRPVRDLPAVEDPKPSRCPPPQHP